MKVFICSTCYDLIDLRAELETFFRDAGLTPVLSESLTSDFQVAPDRNSIETCLSNVRNADALVVILSQRYGPSLKEVGYDDLSATHLEYREARKAGKPIYMYVRDRLDADFSIWKANENKDDLKLVWCKRKDDWGLFGLINEHKKLTENKEQNNWLWVFRTSVELKQRLTADFKETFARAMVVKLLGSGRLPFLEVTGIAHLLIPDGHLHSSFIFAI